MHASRHLLGELTQLGEALEGSGDDLPTIVAVLLDDLVAAVPSFTGLVMTVRVDGEPLILSTVDPDTVAVSSMLLPLYLITTAHPAPSPPLPSQEVQLVFYAADPDAFAELAADTRAVYGLDGQVELDCHLPPPTATGHAATLGPARLMIDQAIGVLIAQGHPMHEARQELADRAAATGVQVEQIAADILANIAGPGH